MGALCLGRVKVLVEGHSFEVRTPKTSFLLPEVVQLSSSVNIPAYVADMVAPCTAKNIHRRDLRRCAYRGHVLRKGLGVAAENRLSVDHWHTARSKGGKIEWRNVLTLNAALNTLKAHKTVEEFEKTQGKPLITPWVPTNRDLFLLALANADQDAFFPSWEEFISPMASQVTDSVKRVLDAFQKPFSFEKAFSA